VVKIIYCININRILVAIFMILEKSLFVHVSSVLKHQAIRTDGERLNITLSQNINFLMNSSYQGDKFFLERNRRERRLCP
jgi:hypothetical protein